MHYATATGLADTNR